MSDGAAPKGRHAAEVSDVSTGSRVVPLSVDFSRPLSQIYRDRSQHLPSRLTPVEYPLRVH